MESLVSSPALCSSCSQTTASAGSPGVSSSALIADWEMLTSRFFHHNCALLLQTEASKGLQNAGRTFAGDVKTDDISRWLPRGLLIDTEVGDGWAGVKDLQHLLGQVGRGDEAYVEHQPAPPGIRLLMPETIGVAADVKRQISHTRRVVTWSRLASSAAGVAARRP